MSTVADQTLIEHAREFATRAHTGQKRASGRPYIEHPTAVAAYLTELGFDAASIAAAYLHDVIEDCGVTRAQLAHEFGDDVAFLVDGVTKLKSIRLPTATVTGKNTDVHTESLKKMFFAMAEDLRVIIIKLADRLNNMRTLNFKHADSRVRKAVETMEIYAPIAARLGMGRLKGELEDLAFPHAHPEEFVWLKRTIKGKYEDRLRYIERTAPLVRRHLADANVTVLDIHARAKRMWSLYTKLKRYDMDPDRVMDLVALRIIVPDIKSCYEALGVIHAHYKPVPGRVKDYIALPKPNGYQSLHTTVFCEKNRIAEIQIRTPAMHDHAENGVAAHWAYAESGKTKAVLARQAELEWINRLKAYLKDIKNAEGMAHLKIDFFRDRIFVLTPHGDVKDLPESATPVDFAYAVHSELGHRTQGALVNAKIVPLTHPLQSGDIVEIMRGKEARPNRDWLRFVKTNQAAKHIRSWFRAHGPARPAEAMATLPVRRASRSRPAGKLRPDTGGTPVIAGQRGLAYRLGKCCTPTAGIGVIGYLTLTRGVTVHTATCANARAVDKRRLLEVHWE